MKTTLHFYTGFMQQVVLILQEHSTDSTDSTGVHVPVFSRIWCCDV